MTYGNDDQHVIVSRETPQLSEVMTTLGTSTTLISQKQAQGEHHMDMGNKEIKARYHTEDLKKTLIKVGSKLLAEEGLAQLSLRKVAKLAGVSHTAPYRHFCDKSELLVSIALCDFETLLSDLNFAKDSHKGQPHKQLKAAGSAYIKMFLKHPEATELMFGGTLKGATAFEDIELYSRSCLGVLEEIIDNGQKMGMFDSTRAATDLAVAAWSIVHGLAMLRSGDQLTTLYSSEDEITEIGDYIAGVLLVGMAANN